MKKLPSIVTGKKDLLPSILRVGIILVLVSSAFLFGAVQPPVLAVEETSIILIFAAWWLMPKGKIEKPPILLPMAIFLAGGIVQVIPLPLPLLKVLSPQAVALRKKLGVLTYWSTISLVPYLTIKELTRWFTAVFLFILVVNLFSTRETLNRLINSLLALSIFQALYGLFLFATGSHALLWYHKKEYVTGRVHGTYRNPDHLAGYLDMVIPLHLSQVLEWRHPTPYAGEEKSKRLLGILLVVILSLALFFTVSRAGIVAFVASFAFWTHLNFRRTGGKGSRLTGYMWLFLILLAAYLLWLGINPILERFFQAASELERGRLLVWKDTIKMIKDFPIFGTGLGTYPFSLPIYKTFPTQSIFTHAHNDYLELLAEGGLVLTLPFLWATVRAIKWSLDSPSLITRGATTGMVAMLIHSFFDFNLHIPANAYIFFAILGISWVAREWRE